MLAWLAFSNQPRLGFSMLRYLPAVLFHVETSSTTALFWCDASYRGYRRVCDFSIEEGKDGDEACRRQTRPEVCEAL